MRILVDMDGVLANFDRRLEEELRRLHPHEIIVPLEQRTKFRVKEEYPVHLHESIESIYATPGFFHSLPPVYGGLDALREMFALVRDVYICTSPPSLYQHCTTEKYQWVNDHLGSDWTRRVIMTKDKTLVRGDILIDDNPMIVGAEIPLWEHVLYDCPYNRSSTSQRRLTWQNWKEVLGLLP